MTRRSVANENGPEEDWLSVEDATGERIDVVARTTDGEDCDTIDVVDEIADDVNIELDNMADVNDVATEETAAVIIVLALALMRDTEDGKLRVIVT